MPEAPARRRRGSQRQRRPREYGIVLEHGQRKECVWSACFQAQLPGTVCDNCAKTPEQANVSSLKGCTQCLAARYCTDACQTAAWPGHKMGCRARKAEMDAKAKLRLYDP